MSYFRTFFAKPSQGSLLSAIFAQRSNMVTRDVAYGDHPRHILDIYRPNQTSDETCVIFFLHGGGWNSGEKEMYGFVGASLAARGFITLIPNYRLFPEVLYSGLMKDAAQAYSFVDRMFAGPADSNSRLFVMGHSSGAHMGALLTYDAEYRTAINPALKSPTGFIGLSGPYGFDPTVNERSKDVFATVKNTEKVQPVHQVREGAPPALLMHGQKDTTVKMLNAVRMAEVLHAVGSAAQAIEYKNIGHTDLILTLSILFQHRAPVLNQIAQFVRVS